MKEFTLTLTIDGKTYEKKISGSIDSATELFKYENVVKTVAKGLLQRHIIETVKILHVSSGKLEKITFDEFLEKIKIHKMYNLVEEYKTTTEFETALQEEEKGYEGPEKKKFNKDDTAYFRHTVIIGEATREYFLNQVKEQCPITDVDVTKKAFIESIQDYSVESLEHFGSPQYLVDLGDNLWGIFSSNEDDFILKRLSPATEKDPGQGAIICYTPAKNPIFKFGE